MRKRAVLVWESALCVPHSLIVWMKGLISFLASASLHQCPISTGMINTTMCFHDAVSGEFWFGGTKDFGFLLYSVSAHQSLTLNLLMELLTKAPEKLPGLFPDIVTWVMVPSEDPVFQHSASLVWFLTYQHHYQVFWIWIYQNLLVWTARNRL